MTWEKIPANTRVPMKQPMFSLRLQQERSKHTWKEFEKVSGVSRRALQNYTYLRYNPDVKTLKKLVSNTQITEKEVEGFINWNDELKALTRDRLALSDVVLLDEESEFIDLKQLCSGMKAAGMTNFFEFPIMTKEEGKDIVVSYKTGPGQVKARPIRITRFVPLDDRTFTAFGLIQAESTKTPRHLYFDFVNSDSLLVRYVLDYFNECWGTNHSQWICEIMYWRNDWTPQKEEEIKEYWSNHLTLPLDSVRVAQGKKTRRSDDAANHGVASLRLLNKAFKTVVIETLNRVIKEKALKSQKSAGAYLKGIMSGDGAIICDKGRFKTIGLAFNPHSNELEEYRILLNTLKVQIGTHLLKGRKKRFIALGSWEAQYNVLKNTEVGLFLNPERNRKFIHGFLDNQYVQPLQRLKELAELSGFAAKDYAQKAGCGKRNAQGCISRLLKLKWIRKVDERLSRYEVTTEGKTFVSTVKKLEELLNDPVPDSCYSGSC